MYPKHLFRFVRHFRTDRWYRTRIIVPASMIANGAFSFLYLFYWVRDNSSYWFLFLSGYYAAMMCLRIHLTRSKNRIDSATTLEGAREAKEDTIKRTGVYLLAVAFAVSLVTNEIIHNTHDFYYPLWTLLLLSGYTGIALFLAISNVIHDHMEDFLIRSTRAVSLVGAIQGLYVLTASIFIYTDLTGAAVNKFLTYEGFAVFFFVVIMSVRLMILPFMKKEFNLTPDTIAKHSSKR